MSVDVKNFIAWIRTFLDDVYALKGSAGGITLNDVYPVGAIYMSMNANMPTSIANLGTWEKIEGKVLLASGEIPIPWLENQRLLLVAGDTGGEFWHQLTVDEMPSHNHTQAQHRHSEYWLGRTGSGSGSGVANTSNSSTTTRYTSYEAPTINNTGGGQAHNNMPPYLVVNAWKRTA